MLSEACDFVMDDLKEQCAYINCINFHSKTQQDWSKNR